MIVTINNMQEVARDLSKLAGKSFTMHQLVQWPGAYERIDTATKYQCRLSPETRRPSIELLSRNQELQLLRVSTTGWPIFMPITEEETDRSSVVVIEEEKVVFSYFGSSGRYFRYTLILVERARVLPITDPTVQVPDDIAALAKICLSR